MLALLILVLNLFFTCELVICCVACFPYFTNVVQLLCSLSGRLHLHCSSVGQDLMDTKKIVELHTV